MRRIRRLRVRWVVAAAGLAVAIFVTGGTASPPQEPDLSNVQTANTRAVGYAPASKLSKELVQTAVAQGATQLENPTALISFYGYENDTVSAGDPTKPQMVPTSGVNTEAQKAEPDENQYLSFRQALNGARPRLLLRQEIPVPGPRGRDVRQRREAGLHHADQPRRGHQAPGHAARHAGLERRSAADDRRRRLGSLGRAPHLHHRERKRPDLCGDAELSRRPSPTSRERSVAAATKASCR